MLNEFKVERCRNEFPTAVTWMTPVQPNRHAGGITVPGGE
jgi:hypothetical protein